MAACTSGDTDGKDSGDTVIVDTVDGGPVAPEVQILESDPRTGDDLHAEVISPDPGASYLWQWASDGAARPDVSGDTVPAVATRKGQVWRVTVVAEINGERSPSGTAEVTIGNTPPSGTLRIEPANPTALQELRVVPEIDDPDPGDADAITWDWEWVVDGTVSAISDQTVNAVATSRGQTWVVRGTPSDGDDVGQPLEATAVIGNSPPEVTSVLFDPPSPSAGEPIEILPQTVDADGDSVLIDVRWEVDGVQIAGESETILPVGHYIKDQEVIAYVTPFDGRDNGLEFVSPVLVVDNTPPNFTGLTLEPSEPSANSVLACVGTGWEDPDGDPPNYIFSWARGGVTIGGATTGTLNGAWFERGDSISCQATAWDGDDQGPTLTSAPVLITNAAPTLTQLVLSTTEPDVTDIIEAIAVDAADADGDDFTLEYRWYVNDFEVAAGQSYGGNLLAGAEVWAEARAFDGVEHSPWVESNHAVVANTPPEVTSLSVTPLQPRTNTPLLADARGADADGHTVTLTYDWKVGGGTVASGPGSSLDPSLFSKGDFVTVEVTPYDGFSDGAVEISRPVLILNTPPTLVDASLTPTEAYTESTLICQPGVSTDVDGDTIVDRYVWLVDGELVGVNDSELSGTWFSKNQSVRCEVTPYDGEATGSAAASNNVLILNTPPVIGSVNLDDRTPNIGQVLHAQITDATDADGDSLTYLYQWYVDGVEDVTTESFDTTGLLQGALISVEVTAFDGTDDGVPVLSDTALVQNSGPDLHVVGVSPITPTTLEDVVADFTATDPDGDAITSSVRWLINDVEVPGVDADILDALLTTKHDVIRAEVTVYDPSGQSDTLLGGPAVVVNSPPQISAATIFPATATEDSVLRCTAGGWYDADGDAASYDYEWYVDSIPVAFGDELSGDQFDRDQSVVCRVTPDDRDIDGRGAWVDSAVITIANTPPTLTGVLIVPDEPTELIAATVVPQDVDDLDDDEVSYTYDWYVNNARVAATPELDGTHYERGDRVYVVVVAGDGASTSVPYTSQTVTIGNSPPVIDAVEILPEEPTAGDDLGVQVEGADPDAADTVQLTYDWYVDDSLVQSGTGDTLAASLINSGSRVYVEVTPTDGVDAGETVASSTITVDNTPPSITGARIEPPSATETSVLTCVPEGWFDADGDPEGYRFSWTVNGSNGGGTATLNGARFDKHDTVTCTAIPYDGTTEGAPVDSAPVVIANSPPTASRVFINQTTPRETSTLRVIVEGPSDDDGDSISLSWAWFVDGVMVSNEETLGGDDFDKGQTVYATVSLDDGDTTTDLTTPSVEILNSPPQLTNLSIAPSDPLVTEDVVGTWQVYDADGDTVTVAWTWFVGGAVAAGQSTTTLPAGSFNKLTDIELMGIPNDGEEDGEALRSNEARSINSAPTVGSADMMPTPVTRDVPPTCTAAGAADADGDAVSFIYTWYVDGQETVVTPTLPRLQYARGQTVACTAKPFDGDLRGAAVTSVNYTVQNAPPTITAVSLNESAPTERSVITVRVLGAADADGDLLQYRYAWFVNEVQVAITASLDGNSFDAGDSVRVEVAPFDGFAVGPAVSSSSVVVQNRPPRIDGVVRITPNTIRTLTDATAVASATDEDGDDISLRYDWRVNDVSVLSGVDETVLSSSLFSKGDEIAVTVTPDDGTELGSSRSAGPIPVLNTAPTVPTVVASPLAPIPGVDPLLCAIDSPATDADGDPVTYDIRWQVGDLVYGNTGNTPTSATVPADAVGSPETWFCQARASDGTSQTDWGPAVAIDTGGVVRTSCNNHYNTGGTSSGVYLIDPDGSGLMEVYCDQTTAGGSWTRMIRTTGNNHDWGQGTYPIISSFAAVEAQSGVYDGFQRLREFDELMIKQVQGAQAGAFATFSFSAGTLDLTLLELLETCRDEVEQTEDDAAFDVVRVAGHTHEYSGLRTGGTLQVSSQSGTLTPVSHFFMCGVNNSDDNDVAYMSFSNATGTTNAWGDGWRGQSQAGTIWSLANHDYCCGTNNHIGTTTPEAYAGWRGEGFATPTAQHQGTYEIYVR